MLLAKNHNMTFEFIGVLALSLFFIFIGWRQRQIDLQEDAGKDKSNPVNYTKIQELVTSLFVVIGAGEYSFAIALLIAYGFIGPTFLIGLGVALLLISRFLPRIYDLVKANSSITTIADGYVNFTTPDYFYILYGRFHSTIATFIVTIAFLGILILQHVLGGQLLSIVTNMPYEFCVYFMGVIVAVYVMIGGFRALFHTDVYQGAFMWVALLILGIYILTNPQGLNYGNAFSQLLEKSQDAIVNLPSDQTIIVFFIITIFAAFSGPDFWQRVNMSKTKEEGKKGAKFAAFAMFLFIIPISLIAIDMQAIGVPIVEGEDALINYLKLTNTVGVEGSWPLLVKAAIGLGLVSAFVSTADTAAMLMATSIQNELRRYGLISTKGDRNLSRKNTNILILIISVIAMIAATTSPDIAEQFSLILGILAVMGLPVFQSLIGRGNKFTAGLALLGGVSIFICQTYLLPKDLAIYANGWYLFLPIVPGLFGFFVKNKYYLNEPKKK